MKDIWKEISEKENFFITRSHHVLAYNMQKKITNYSQDPSIENKDAFLKSLNEIRSTKAAELFFLSQIDNKKNKRFIDHIRQDEARREKPINAKI